MSTEVIELGDAQVNSRAYCSSFNFKGGDQQKKVSLLSGGERNRVHMARLLKSGGNVLLLDEPTASLDKKNKKTVLSLINGAKHAGAAILGIFHDDEARKAVCDRMIDIRELCHVAGEVT